MIDVERYHTIRSRLIKLHAIITKRLYPVWVYPSHLMTTDQIRNREYSMNMNTIPDTEVYSRAVERQLKIPAIIELLQNVTEEQPLSINRPHKNVIQIYEVIQEHNALWYELYVTNSNYGSINPLEIQYLEKLSFYLYEEYAKIRHFLDARESRKQSKIAVDDNHDTGLAGMLGLLALDGNGNKVRKTEFISYYDLLTTKVLPNFGNIMPNDAYVQPQRNMQDTLLRQEQAQQKYGIWGS